MRNLALGIARHCKNAKQRRQRVVHQTVRSGRERPASKVGFVRVAVALQYRGRIVLRIDRARKKLELPAFGLSVLLAFLPEFLNASHLRGGERACRRHRTGGEYEAD